MRPHRRALAGVLTVTLALSLAACGDGAPSPEEQVRSTLQRFTQAASHDDSYTACQTLAPQLVRNIERQNFQCEVVLKRALSGLRDARLDVLSVRVQGNQAFARVRTSAAGQRPSVDTVRLVMLGESWRIASLGGR